MKIMHNFALQVDELARLDFKAIGIELEHGFDSFKIEEGSSKWNNVQPLLLKHKPCQQVETIFTKKEIENASFLKVTANWHNGYPQPEKGFEYLNATYCLDHYCKRCGTGATQVRPFLLKKEPIWGSRSFFSTNWVFDEIFIKPEAAKLFSSVSELSFEPVLKHKSKDALKNVLQMKIRKTTNLLLDSSNYAFEVCRTCLRKKFIPITKGFFPHVNLPESQITRSKEFFGSGSAGYNAIFVSKEFTQIVLKNKLKGLDFHPVNEI